MRGLILAGGKGTRLLPATRVLNKHMVPILNHPMITYPLETLKALGVIDIMIVSGGNHIGSIAEFLGDGSEFGVDLTYRVQKEAGGIAQALGLAADFCRGRQTMVILGDNVFDNEPLIRETEDAPWSIAQRTYSNAFENKATLFLKWVPDPQRFGVAVLNSSDRILDIEEKPKEPKSNYAVTGLYQYPSDVFDVVKTLKPSARGELEIADVSNYYVKEGRCDSFILDGFWSDAGTPESLKKTIDWAYGKDYVQK